MQVSLKTLLTCFLLQIVSAQAAPEARWVVQTDSDVVFVFVHGIFSDSDRGWKHSDGTFWPDLIIDEKRLDRPNIYMGGYPSSLADPNFEIESAARHLFGRLNGVGPGGEPSVLSKQQIIFVAHSTGGLVVRQMLINQAAAFGDKKIGLFLLASPSRGSEWASRVSGLTKFLGHKMVAQLEKDSPYTGRLDKLFSELLARKRVWMIAGMDVFESRFVVPYLLVLNKEVVVNPDESRYYFGEPRLVPSSDHFSISKPSMKANESDKFPHEYLVEFYAQRFKPEVLALSRCQSNSHAEISHYSLVNQLGLYSPALTHPLTQIQFTSDAPSERNPQETCFTNKLKALRWTQAFHSYGGVRCEGGGLGAKGQKKEATIQFAAPPNMRIVGAATSEMLSLNRGKRSDVKYKDVDGSIVAAEVQIMCESPSLLFGPGAWAEIELKGTLEQVPTDDQISKARRECGD